MRDNAGIARLVVAVKDPDERVNGAGLSRVAAANIKIGLGVLQSGKYLLVYNGIQMARCH